MADAGDGFLLDRQPYQGTESMPKLMVPRQGAFSPPSPQPQSSAFATVVSFSDVAATVVASPRSGGGADYASSSAPMSPASLWEFSIHDREQRHALLSHTIEISQALRPEGARVRMMPVLEMLCAFDDAGIPLAQLIPELVVVVGGPDYIDSMRPLLSNLCLHVDPAVTTDVAESIRGLMMKYCPTDDFNSSRNSSSSPIRSFLTSMVREMCASAWSAPRSVGAALVAELYRLAPLDDAKEQLSLREMFQSFCKEEEDIFVRRAAVASVTSWTNLALKQQSLSREPAESSCPSGRTASSPSNIPATITNSPIIDLLENLIQPIILLVSGDERHDTLRISLVRSVLDMSGVMSETLAKRYLADVMRRFCTDRSWRVRFTVAKSMTDVFARILRPGIDVEDSKRPPGGPTTSSSIAAKLFRDEETEVRAAAAAQLHSVCLQFPDDVVDSIFIPLAVACATEESSLVRTSVAPSVAALAKLRASRLDVQIQLVRVLVDLMADSSESTQVAAVRSVSMLPDSAWQHESATFGPLSASLEHAAISPKWRIRESVASVLADICIHISPREFDSGLGGSVLQRFLSDPVASLRSTAVAALGRIGHVYGSAWAARVLMTQLDEAEDGGVGSAATPPQSSQCSSAVRRVNFINIISVLLPVVENNTNKPPSASLSSPQKRALLDDLEKRVSAVVLSLSRDPVSNVRLIVARELATLHLYKFRIALAARDNALACLREDTNADVRRATQCLDEPF